MLYYLVYYFFQCLKNLTISGKIKIKSALREFYIKKPPQSYIKMLIYLCFAPCFCEVTLYRRSVIGAEVQALGARMRIKCASVGAIWSMVTGVWIMAGFTECPMKISGEGI